MKDPCLECQLAICDDRSKECAFVQITRDREAKNEYYREFYQQNREKEIARVRKWEKENRERRNKYRRDRRAMLKERMTEVSTANVQ